MDNNSEKQGKRRFYFYLIFTIVLGSAMFYSGYQFGKIVGKEDLLKEIQKVGMDDDSIISAI